MRRRPAAAVIGTVASILSFAGSAHAASDATLALQVPPTVPLGAEIRATLTGAVEVPSVIHAMVKPGDAACGPSFGADAADPAAGTHVVGAPVHAPAPWFEEQASYPTEGLAAGSYVICTWLQRSSEDPYEPEADAVAMASFTVTPPVPASAPAPAPPVLAPPVLVRAPAPAVTAAALRPSTLAPARRGAMFATRGRARLTFALSAAADVRFTIERRARGQWRKLTGALARRLPAGGTALRFTGRWRGRALGRGRYRLALSPTGTGEVAYVPFRIARAPQTLIGRLGCSTAAPPSGYRWEWAWSGSNACLKCNELARAWQQKGWRTYCWDKTRPPYDPFVELYLFCVKCRQASVGAG